MSNEDDVLERSKELDAKIEEREKMNNRNPVVSGLLVSILVVCLFTLVFVWINTVHRTSQISNSDTRQTQLACAAVPHPMQYSICRQVGLPQRIGEVK
jgi:cell division septal protein FtsQ